MPEVTSTATTDLLERTDTPQVEYHTTHAPGSVEVVIDMRRPTPRESS